MTTRIVDMPVLASRAAELQADIYNLWRRARLHFDIPLRLDLPGMAQMVLILDEDSWVVVNEQQADLPVLAWVDFQDEHRDNLHKPMPCTLNFYHYMASSLRSKVLTCMAKELEARLQDKTTPSTNKR